MCRVGPAAAQGTLGVSSTSLWTLPVVLRPQAALSEMLPVRSAAGLHGTPNERSESPCECPFACRGRPLAASLAQSVRCRRDESARIATAHRYTPALHGLRYRPVDSPPSCMHIRAAATCIADRVCMFMWVGPESTSSLWFFYPRRAKNRTFRPPVTQKQKNSLNFRKG